MQLMRFGDVAIWVGLGGIKPTPAFPDADRRLAQIGTNTKCKFDDRDDEIVWEIAEGGKQNIQHTNIKVSEGERIQAGVIILPGKTRYALLSRGQTARAAATDICYRRGGAYGKACTQANAERTNFTVP